MHFSSFDYREECYFRKIIMIHCHCDDLIKWNVVSEWMKELNLNWTWKVNTIIIYTYSRTAFCKSYIMYFTNSPCIIYPLQRKFPRFFDEQYSHGKIIIEHRVSAFLSLFIIYFYFPIEVNFFLKTIWRYRFQEMLKLSILSAPNSGLFQFIWKFSFRFTPFFSFSSFTWFF